MVRTRSSSAAAALRASSSSPDSNTSDPSSPAPAIAPVMTSISASSNHNTNSISYLAPFVASILRDQVVTDLLAESKRKDERIQQQAEDRLRLELTGRNGDLVYCKASMKHGISATTPHGTSFWDVYFDPRDGTNTTVPNFVETVAGLELRLGGVVLFKLSEATCCIPHARFDRTRDDDDEPQMRIVLFVSSDDGIRVCGRVGPIRYNDFATVLPRRMHVTDLVRFLKDHQINNNNGRVLLPQLQILSVAIRKSQIKGTLPLLEDTMEETATSE